jgi:hypothetical protein
MFTDVSEEHTVSSKKQAASRAFLLGILYYLEGWGSMFL